MGHREPVFGAGKVRYDDRGEDQRDELIGVVRELVSKLGLAGEINRRLTLLKKHRYHESDHVLNIAYNLLCGGTRLEDLGSLRNNADGRPGGEGDPEPDGGGRFHAALRRGGRHRAAGAFNAVRPRCWRGRGRDLLAPVAYVDVDGTLAPTLGDKKDAWTQGGVGHHPLVISGTRARCSLVNRPGNDREPRGRGGVDRQGAP